MCVRILLLLYLCFLNSVFCQDECEDAVVLGDNFFGIFPQGSVSQSTGALPPDCNGDGVEDFGPDTWFVFHSDDTYLIQFSTCDGLIDEDINPVFEGFDPESGKLEIFFGSCCDEFDEDSVCASLECIEDTVDLCPLFGSSATFYTVPDEHYYFRTGGPGPYPVRFSAQIPNRNTLCSEATTILSGYREDFPQIPPVATEELCGLDGAALWFRYTETERRSLVVLAYDADIAIENQSFIAIGVGTDCGEEECVTFTPGTGGSLAGVLFSSEVGVTYNLRLSPTNPSDGSVPTDPDDYSLNEIFLVVLPIASTAAENDECEDASEVIVLNREEFDVESATNSNAETCNSEITDDLWYSFDSPGDVYLTISTCGSDGIVNIYESCQSSCLEIEYQDCEEESGIFITFPATDSNYLIQIGRAPDSEDEIIGFEVSHSAAAAGDPHFMDLRGNQFSMPISSLYESSFMLYKDSLIEIRIHTKKVISLFIDQILIRSFDGEGFDFLATFDEALNPMFYLNDELTDSNDSLGRVLFSSTRKEHGMLNDFRKYQTRRLRVADIVTITGGTLEKLVDHHLDSIIWKLTVNTL